MITETALSPPPARVAFLRAAADTDWVERRAKLFETGDYPDKGVSIAAADLKALCAAFGEPVPVLIEHADSPFELGYLTAVEAMGAELFGTIALTSEANALVERSGARSLSIGLAPDLTSIREVSLVRNPRIASAQLYSDGPRFEVEWSARDDWERKFRALERDQAERDADRQIAEWMAEGRLTPAQRPFAKALLTSDGIVAFDGERRPVASLLRSLVDRQPGHAMFGERAPALTPDYSEHLMMPEEVAFYQRHFPGVALDEIAKKRRP